MATTETTFFGLTWRNRVEIYFTLISNYALFSIVGGSSIQNLVTAPVNFQKKRQNMANVKTVCIVFIPLVYDIIRNLFLHSSWLVYDEIIQNFVPEWEVLYKRGMNYMPICVSSRNETRIAQELESSFKIPTWIIIYYMVKYTQTIYKKISYNYKSKTCA